MWESVETVLHGSVSSSTNLERRVKHHQLGAGGHDVVALVGLHEARVDITVRFRFRFRFSSCEQDKSRKTLSEGEISPQSREEHRRTPHGSDHEAPPGAAISTHTVEKHSRLKHSTARG